MNVDVIQSGPFVPSKCQYSVESPTWFEITLANWQPNQLVTLECADGSRVACGDYYNRYACHKESTRPPPRKLLMSPPDSTGDTPNITCCSLGKSCLSSITGSGTSSDEPTCEYTFNTLEDTSFVEIRIQDMTKTVKVQCGNDRVFKCLATQWGKYTCSFKDSAHVNRNLNNVLCPEPRNALINGQCCNLGKGCVKPANTGDPYFNISSNTQTPTGSSAPSLITLAAFCGLVAIAAVIMGAVILYKRAKAASAQAYAKLSEPDKAEKY